MKANSIRETFFKRREFVIKLFVTSVCKKMNHKIKIIIIEDQKFEFSDKNCKKKLKQYALFDSDQCRNIHSYMKESKFRLSLNLHTYFVIFEQ